MNKDNPFSEKEYFLKAENKLAGLFLKLKEEGENTFNLVEQINKTLYFSEKMAPTEVASVTGKIKKLIEKEQSKVIKFLNTLDDVSIHDGFVVLKKGEPEIKFKLEPAEDILKKVFSIQMESFGYFHNLATILKQDNYIFLQMLFLFNEKKIC